MPCRHSKQHLPAKSISEPCKKPASQVKIFFASLGFVNEKILHTFDERFSAVNLTSNRQALALIPKTFAASNSKISQAEKFMSTRRSSLKTFRAVEVLHSAATVVEVFLQALTILIKMYSQMSKLAPPVSASRPLNRLKLLFGGKFAEFSFDSVSLLTHGGFPITSRLSFGNALMSKSKKFALTILTRSSLKFSVQVLQ